MFLEKVEKPLSCFSIISGQSATWVAHDLRFGLCTIFPRNKRFICFLRALSGAPRPGVYRAVEKRPSAFVSLILRRSTYQQVRLTAQDFGGLASGRF
jgi:hypothetical protein